MNNERYVVPPPPGSDEEPLVLSDKFPEEIAKAVADAMSGMNAIIVNKPLTRKGAVEYKRLANVVIDTLSGYIRSAACDFPQERKDRLLAWGDALRLEVEHLP